MGTTNYVDGIHYQGGSIDFIQTGEGSAVNMCGSYKYEYNLTDHLGNVRYSFDIYQGNVRRLQSDDYYAFGLRKQGTPIAGNNRYLYNGKELQEELGLTGQDGQYDYGARFYDPVIGRWNVIDPLAEGRYGMTPYHYTSNNPINRIDPDGRWDWVMGENGRPRWDDNVTNANDKDLKAGDTYMGKTSTYTAKGVYAVDLYDKKDWAGMGRKWDYRGSGDVMTYKEPGMTIQEAVQMNMPMLKLAEGIATGTALIASGGIGAVEAGGTYAVGMAARRTDFLAGLAENSLPKLLNQFNSVESLLGNTVLEATKKGALQGFVRGDGQSIFNAISRGGQHNCRMVQNCLIIFPQKLVNTP